jgi:hypothetical protein
METRGPQSTQSVPKAHVANLEPGPPLSPALRQSFVYTMAEECGGGGGETLRAPQSVPYAHIGSSEPGPPSKHSASDAKKHVVVQMPVPSRKGQGALAAGGGSGWPGPQSAQSVPYRPLGCSAPGLPVTEKVCSDGGGGEVAPRKS